MTDTTTVDEQYTSATHSSNLRMEAEKRGDCDVIVAVGWCRNQMYGGLTRLRAEYDGISHPKKMTQEAIAAYAANLEGSPRDRDARAQADAEAWHLHELQLMVGRLKSLPAVRAELTWVADRFGIADPARVAAAVLLHWVDDVCPACHGVQRERVKGTPSLSAVVCPVCRGSGKSKAPCGESGRRLANYIDDTIDSARNSIKKRLRQH